MLGYIRKNWFVFFAIVTYLFFSAYYMGPSVLDCTNSVNGFGDSTSGPIWKFSLDGSSPISSYNKYTNYPFGESMASPVDAAVIGQTLLIWGASSVLGPVCGYNTVNLVGFLATSILMFGFIYALIRNRWIALLAGYAVAFTPYLQVKVGVHPGYGYAAILIGVLWALLALLRTRTISKSVVLALLIAICFYFDPYFSLLVASLLMPLGVVYGITNAVRWRQYSHEYRGVVVKQIRLLSISVGIVAVLVAPLFVIMTTQWDSISSSLSGTRNNISEVAKLCSNWPHEYLLPFPDSPLLDLFGSSEQSIRSTFYSFSTCGITEDAVGIGFVILLVVLLGIVVFIWEKLNRRSLGLSSILRYDPYVVVFGLAGVSISALLIAFPPVHLFGVPSPSEILITLTSTWRIISREYIVLNLSAIVLFAVFLAYFTSKFRANKKIRIFGFLLLFGLLFVQYQTYHPFAGNEPTKFNYSQIPQAYSWLKSKSDIKAIAEYPIEKVTESNSLGYYLTMQSIHKKPLLNTALASSPQNQLRSSLKNLSDPQTVRTLRSLGISAVISHGVSVEDIESIPYLKVVYSSRHYPTRPPESQSVNKDVLVVAEIEDAPPTSYSFQFLDSLPYNSVIQKSAADWQYEVPSGTRAIVDNIKSNDLRHGLMYKLCLNVSMAAKADEGAFTVSDKESSRTLYKGSINGVYQHFEVQVPIHRELIIKNEKGYNMRISAIGCSE